MERGRADLSHMVPEGGIKTCGFIVVGYLDAEGDLAYATELHGEVPLSTMIGLIELSKGDVIHHYRPPVE